MKRMIGFCLALFLLPIWVHAEHQLKLKVPKDWVLINSSNKDTMPDYISNLVGASWDSTSLDSVVAADPKTFNASYFTYAAVLYPLPSDKEVVFDDDYLKKNQKDMEDYLKSTGKKVLESQLVLVNGIKVLRLLIEGERTLSNDTTAEYTDLEYFVPDGHKFALVNYYCKKGDFKIFQKLFETSIAQSLK